MSWHRIANGWRCASSIRLALRVWSRRHGSARTRRDIPGLSSAAVHVVSAGFAHKLRVHCGERPCEDRVAPWSGHSHSIVSGTHKHLEPRDFLSGYAKLTVRTTAKNFRLGAIDGDRCRKRPGSALLRGPCRDMRPSVSCRRAAPELSGTQMPTSASVAFHRKTQHRSLCSTRASRALALYCGGEYRHFRR